MTPLSGQPRENRDARGAYYPAVMAGIYPNDLEKLTLAEMATAVLDWLGGHSLPGGAKHGRVPQLCQLVQKAAGAIEKDDPRWRDAVQAF